MASTLEASSDQVNSTPKQSECVTDFRQFTARRYKTVEIPDVGRVRLRSLKAREFELIAKQEGVRQKFMAIALAVVDENGDAHHTFDDEGIDYMVELDAVVLAKLSEAINEFCLGERVNVDTVEGNSDASRTE